MDTASESSLDQASLLVVSGSQLRTFVQENELPVLVEFGVDFNANASLVAQLGGTIFPRRILERHGQNSQSNPSGSVSCHDAILAAPTPFVDADRRWATPYGISDLPFLFRKFPQPVASTSSF